MTITKQSKSSITELPLEIRKSYNAILILEYQFTHNRLCNCNCTKLLRIVNVQIFSNHSRYSSAIKQIESLLKIITEIAKLFIDSSCGEITQRRAAAQRDTAQKDFWHPYFGCCAGTSQRREILGTGAVYLHYLNRSRKQYILYEIACIHHLQVNR
ncbi:hypothetical protein T07_12358 [Trichinella nelsoni]|uniref:Uncharacterized protein n=1 Tax=Trichinella nelsoni TaxID=6336 RepID=A0A0V0S9I3_9BILA|nr:hypothetical protein T07_12358 [Trichinella nelsoni]